MTVDNASNSCRKSAVSVLEMARIMGLSRSRFYQLMGSGKIPAPVYNPKTRRPFYDQTLQKICLKIKQTGIAYDNTIIMFNTARQTTQKRPQKPDVTQTIESPTDNKYSDIVEALAEMGVRTNVEAVGKAIKQIYPNGQDDVDEGVMLRDLFRHLRKKT